MDRKTIYPGQIPLETDLLGTNKNVMIALGKLAAAVFGTGNYINGLTVGPNSPAALNVVVQPGELYSLQNVDNSAYSSIAADTAHQIVKQGILMDAMTLSTPAPATAGYSINYLIQAAFSEVDIDAVVLPYYNASNPSQAYSGPGGAGTTNNTTRQNTITVTAKAGIAATTGTQTTPAADAGYIGLFVVTVANGQTTVTAPNISQLSTAPIIPAGIVPAIQSHAYAYVPDTGAANAYQAAYSPAVTAVTDGMVLRFKAKNANTGASTFSANGLTAQPIWGGDHAVLTGGEIAANGDVEIQWNSSLNGTGAWVILESTNGYTKGPTPTPGDHSTKRATTAFVQDSIRNVKSITSGTTALTAADAGFLIVDASSGNVTINLPAANSGIGVRYEFRRIDTSTNTVTVNRAGSDTIESVGTSFTISDEYANREIISDGESKWLSPLIYESGKFTPTARGTGTAGTFTYSQQTGFYTRLGDRAMFQINVGWTASTGTGSLRIGGLPFAPLSGADSPVSVRFDNLVVGTGKQLCGYVSSANNEIVLEAADLAGGGAADVSVDSSIGTLMISGNYLVQ